MSWCANFWGFCRTFQSYWILLIWMIFLCLSIVNVIGTFDAEENNSKLMPKVRNEYEETVIILIISAKWCVVSGQYGHMVIWSSGHLVIWSSVHLVNMVIWSIWSSGHLVIWSSSQYGHLVICSSVHLVNIVIWPCGQYYHLVIWSSGHLVIWSSGHMVIWSSGHLVI